MRCNAIDVAFQKGKEKQKKYKHGLGEVGGTPRK